MTKLVLIFTLLFLSTASLLKAQDLGDATESSTDDKDFHKAFRAAQIGADRGDAKAQGDLGLMYEKGLAVAQDDKKAAYWLAEAAYRGDASAENNLGVLFFNGKGVIQDYAQARHWFEKAADQGLASADCNLGLIYGEGLGLPKDLKRSLSYYQKAANQDDVDAQVNLGMIYSLGEATTKDNRTAYFWFYRALQHQFADQDKKDEVRDDIVWMEKHMSNEDVAAAKTKAMHWKPDTQTVEQTSPTPDQP